jgi:hypothetical protein
MDVLIIDSGIVDHKAFSGIHIYTTGYKGQNDLLSVDDSTGHGTAVAELVAKKHPGLNVYVLKLFNVESQCTITDLIDALEFVTLNNKYSVINMSFGITTYDDPEQVIRLQTLCDELTEQGSILVSAFDNEGSISYPAYFDCVIGVDTSKIARNKSEYEYAENSIVNVRGFGANQKVAWKDPQYTIVGGTSFACANITNIIISLANANDNCLTIKSALKDNAIKVGKFSESSAFQQAPSWLKDSKAILLPFNKEIHSLAAYEDLLSFPISAIYDFKYTARIGTRVSDILPYRNVSEHVIQNYEQINWQSDEFDIVIAGHLSEMSWRCKRDLLKEVVEKCCKYNKMLYSFDSIEPYEKLINDCGLPLSHFFYPHMGTEHILNGRFGKLHDIISPVFAVIGTSSQQGKFTVQLNLRDQLIKKGYRVGQIGSEPSSLCFQMDYVYPYGYQSTVNATGFDGISILNQMVHDIEMRGADICLVGTQSASVPYSSYNLSTIPLHQIEYLFGTNPDAFVLCVNPHDDIDYIARTISGVESYFLTKCIAIVVYPLSHEQVLGGLFKKKNIAGSEAYKTFKELLSLKVGVEVFDMDDTLKTDALADCVLNFFSGPAE